MYKLGVSVYPERETLEEISNYLKIAAQNGFTKVFSSMFSVPGTNEEVINYFKQLTVIAHNYGMTVSTDANPKLFNRLEATPDNLLAFNKIGIDIIRMDLPFGDDRDIQLIENPYNIKIEFSTMMQTSIDKIINYGIDGSRFSVCHNFYPERYTGMDIIPFNKINAHWKEKGVAVSAFISSQVEKTHGPWPVYDGLPTVEEHRILPVDLQVRHLVAVGNVDEFIFGNAFASEEELKTVKETIDLCSNILELPKEKLGFLLTINPNFGKKKIPLNIKLEEGISELEKRLLLEYPAHSDLGDGTSYMYRSRFTRGLKDSIPLRPYKKSYYTKGDVVIVNDELAHYRGEVQIVLKDMQVDGQRNLLGRIREKEIMLLDYIKPGDLFQFIAR